MPRGVDLSDGCRQKFQSGWRILLRQTENIYSGYLWCTRFSAGVSITGFPYQMGLQKIQIPKIKIISWDFLCSIYFFLKLCVFIVIIDLCGSKYSSHHIEGISQVLPKSTATLNLNKIFQGLFKCSSAVKLKLQWTWRSNGFKYNSFREASKHHGQM